MLQKMKAFYARVLQCISAHAKWIVLAAMALAVVPFLLISIYSRPCVDDFSYSISLYHMVQSGSGNLFALLKEAVCVDISYYHSWQGLYTSAFVLSLQPGILGERYYFIGAVLLIALMAACLYYFVSACFDRLGVSLSKACCAAILLTALLQGLPSMAEGLYWFNGAWNYTPFFFLILVNIGLVLRFTAPSGKRRQLVCAVILSFVISGGNHVTSFLNILVLLLAALISRRKALLAPLASAIVGFAIMYLAPGTAVRQVALGHEASVPGTIVAVIKQAEAWLGEWSNAEWFLCMALAFGLALCIRPPQAVRLPNPIWVMAACAMLWCGAMCVPNYAMGNFGEGRVVNILWMIFLLISAVIVIYTTVWFNHKGRPAWLDGWCDSAGWRTALVVFALGLLVYSGSNLKDVVRELADGTAAAYAAGYDSRMAGMQQLAEGETLYTLPLVHSKALYFNDVSDDVNGGWNRAWESYYGHPIVAEIPSENETA